MLPGSLAHLDWVPLHPRASSTVSGIEPSAVCTPPIRLQDTDAKAHAWSGSNAHNLTVIGSFGDCCCATTASGVTEIRFFHANCESIANVNVFKCLIWWRFNTMSVCGNASHFLRSSSSS